MPPTGTHSRAALATRRLRSAPRAAWFGARARNAVKRPRKLIGVGGAIFVIVMLSYLFLPAGARGVVKLVTREEISWRDTTVLVTREANARRRLEAADSALAYVRGLSASLLALLETDPVVPAEALRDSTRQDAGALRALITRADNAPLPESYRAIARSSFLQGDRRVAALVDSMTMIERERDELGGGATVDPVYVALTTQANELGRRISQIARARLDALARESAGGSITAQAERDTAALSLPDSLPVLRVRAEAFTAYEAAHRSLESARADNAAADSADARARAQVQMAPMPILLLAALVLAAAFAFALSMLDEMRSPRVADGAEAERLTDLRVLGVARQRVVPADRLRRAADRTVPASLDPTFDGYRVVAWHLSSQWPKDGIVTVTGDDMTIAATVAANLAAVMANDARVTLLIDSDLAQEPVRTLLALPRSPGLVAVLENRRRWSESLIGVPVGRGRTLDILPSGVRAAPLGPAESQALLGEIQRAARRHDATIVVAPLAMVKRYRAGDDVVVCATQTRTRLSTLARTVASLTDEGARVRGVVLWSGAAPALPRDESSALQTPAA
jgi:Mrp family chromosome partitioning ATPase